MLGRESMVWAWPLKHFLKWFGVPSVGFQPPLWSVAATSESLCRCFLFFLLAEQLEVPSPVPLSRLALPSRRSKITPTASSPKAWLVAMSRSSLVVRGPLCPSIWTKDSQVVVPPSFKDKTRYTLYVSPGSQISHIATNKGNIKRQYLLHNILVKENITSEYR